jgi:predicted unusual protein kinase regulating ubiquinone biosynthesis (AarF/ABC1/UbiB family)
MVASGTMGGAAGTDLAAVVDAWAEGFYNELDFELEGERQTYFREEILANCKGCYVPQVSHAPRGDSTHNIYCIYRTY